MEPRAIRVEKITVQIGKTKLELTVEEAQKLLDALADVVGRAYPAYPYLPYTPWVPATPYITWKDTGTGTHDFTISL